MILRTQRLTLRRFTLGDLAAASALMNVCFGEEPPETRRAWLDWQCASYQAHEHLHQPPYGDYAVCEPNGALVGSVGLVPSIGPFGALEGWPKVDGHTPELGLFWATDPAYRGRGYATEAARGWSSWLMEHLQAARLVATTESENSASIAVMHKIGMTVQTAPASTPEWFEVIGVLRASEM